jgi:ferric-dicitrate binding protein FerR (iron transport regulator)
MNDPRRWIEAYLDDNLSEEEERALWAWLKTHPDHLRAFVEANKFEQEIRSAVVVSVEHESAGPFIDREGSAGSVRAGHRRRWAVLSAALAVVAAAALILAWNARDPGLRPTVVSTRGAVEIIRDDRWIPASPGEGVRPGERIRTAGDGSAALRLSDGSSIHLEGSTDLVVPRAGAPRAFRVRTGAVRCAVAEQPSGRPLVFQTPHADLTVPGTAFDLVAAAVESRVRVEQGRVRWADGGAGFEVFAGEASTADLRGVQAWVPVCDLDFSVMATLPPQLDTVFCDSKSLHTRDRRIRPAPGGIRLGNGGLRFAPQRESYETHGLIVTRWAEAVGGDVALEVGLTAEPRWALQLSVDGDSFEGYRIIFAAPKYPNGIAIDSLHPSGVALLAQDPRALPDRGDHVLRVEKRGPQLRVWVDRELRIDTVVDHPLAPGRKRTFALAQFGSGPLVRSLRVWKPVDKGSGRLAATFPTETDPARPFPVLP